MKILEQLLSGFGAIPKGWKSGVFGFLVATVAMLSEFGVPIPDFIDESLMAKVAAVVAIGLSLILKKMRHEDERESAG